MSGCRDSLRHPSCWRCLARLCPVSLLLENRSLTWILRSLSEKCLCLECYRLAFKYHASNSPKEKELSSRASKISILTTLFPPSTLGNNIQKVFATSWMHTAQIVPVRWVPCMHSVPFDVPFERLSTRIVLASRPHCKWNLTWALWFRRFNLHPQLLFLFYPYFACLQQAAKL